LRLDRPLLLLVLVAASALAGGCGRSQGAPASAVPAASRALRVRTAPVAVREVVYRIKALGSLEAEELVQVTAEVEGAVAVVRFDEGDKVTPQTVLVRIDPDRYRLEAERTAATYKRALADQQRAESDLKRREELAREQLVAAEELNRSQQETERLKAEASAAKAAADWAAENVRRSEVRPSRAGVINTKAVSTGQFVKSGDVLATLVDTSRLRLRFRVSEAESLRAQEGQDVAFRVAALGERDFVGRIYHVGEVADPASRQVEVLAWVKNPGVLKPGFFAEVTLATEAHKEALVVPESAIQASEKGFVVYTVAEGKAQLRSVQIGLRTEDRVVEIISGLKPAETVVVEGSDRLADGMQVQEAAAAGAPPGKATAGPRGSGQ
jgi:multidrug efflux system membrane fusion protein